MGKVYTNIGRGAPKKSRPSSTTTSVPERWKKASVKAKAGIAQAKPAVVKGASKPKAVTSVHGTPVSGGGGMHQMGTARTTKPKSTTTTTPKGVGQKVGSTAKQEVKTHAQQLEDAKHY